MSTLDTIILLLLLLSLLAIVWLFTEISTLKKIINQQELKDPDTQKLRLQAYERMTLLSERLALQNLISRTPANGRSCRQMQGALVEHIKEEYEYNLSQQIYVSPEIWKAVSNLKEQNIYIINQLASTMPPQASAMDLNKQIIDFLMNNPRSSLHSAILEAINYEAKKLM